MFTKFGKHGVDIALKNSRSTEQVFWSDNGNSFVIVDDADGDWQKMVDGEPVPCFLFSINGIGEIRWEVSPAT